MFKFFVIISSHALGDNILEPSFLYRKKILHTKVIDFTTRIFYLKDSWAGLTYRTDQTVAIGIGFAKNKTHFSYSYDHSFAGEIMRHTFGTHEIAISFRIETIATKRHIGFWDY